jgi:tetratricopeptide (TPR) repeat protein
MNTKIFWLSILAVILSFAGGFYLANALNRNELTALRTDNERLKKNEADKTQSQTETTLTEDEIRQKIAEADKNPNDFSFQRNMGLALYRYGAMKQDVNLISESARLLQRTFNNNPKDYDVTVALGNAYYDEASIKKDNESFKKSREFYAKALEQKPDDADVRADFGSTFLFAEPAETAKAIAELEKSLQINPKNERALLFITQAFLKDNNTGEADKYFARLREINPKTPDIAELKAQISPGENSVQK